MPKVSLKQQAYSLIKEKILKCDYMPNSFLNEDLLCEEFGFSRTPIRDALGRLEQEDLIKIIPKKGFFVAPFSIKEINMAYEMRNIIEKHIILNYCKNLHDNVFEALHKNLKEYEQSIAKNDFLKAFHIDDLFHRILLSQCDNHYLLDSYNKIHNQNYRMRILSGITYKSRQTFSVSEHLKIIEALEKNNLEQAVQYMEEHLIASKKTSLEAFISDSSLI